MLEELREVNEYIWNKIEENDDYIKELEEYAKDHRVPIVTKEVAEFLKFFTKMKRSKNILEIGTAIGYSGSIFAKECGKFGGEVTTIEIDENSYEIAKSNFLRAGISNVKQIFGDAVDKLEDLKDENYDLIFIDAAKGKYKDFFDKSFSMLNSGGVVLIDNILFRGYPYKKEYPKRYKTLVRKLDEFIDYLYKDYNFVLLPFGDGMGIVYKES